MSQYREEKDSMGPVRIPADMLYGAQTERARQNFPISRLRFDRRFLYAMGVIKRAASEVNEDLGLLDAERAGAIGQAAQELMDGDLDAHFVLDRKVNKPFHELAPATAIFRTIVGVDSNGMRIEPSFDHRPKIFKTINHKISSNIAVSKIQIGFIMRRQENAERF